LGTFFSPHAHQIITSNDEIRFVSRANPKTNDRHVILGVVRTIADMCLQRPEGKYVLVKDPNKQILRLYEVPAGSFEDDNEGEIIEEVEEAED
jgi:translation initiation factor 3 subunit D